jgi:hypothetical protein
VNEARHWDQRSFDHQLYKEGKTSRVRERDRDRDRERQRQREGEKGIPEGGSREIEPRNWKWSRLQE